MANSPLPCVSDLISLARKNKLKFEQDDKNDFKKKFKITISKHVVQGHLALNVKPAQVGLRVDDDTVSLVDVANNGALELLGSRHLDEHDRLDNVPVALGVRLLHGTLGR